MVFLKSILIYNSLIAVNVFIVYKDNVIGRLAQLVEHLVYTEEVSSSSLLSPTLLSIAVNIFMSYYYYFIASKV